MTQSQRILNYLSKHGGKPVTIDRLVKTLKIPRANIVARVRDLRTDYEIDTEIVKVRGVKRAAYNFL